ncbi:ABC transporter permease [Dactylosporangium sp. NPDC000555]|uniref:ABC transporter permease n=1 Tax=Dactylosporangium sp. NPDC000555 TaxID=3154260 RepID=UPI00332AFFFA
MVRLVTRRLVWAVPMLFVVTFFSFVLVSLVPGDPARSVLGQLATEQQVSELRQELGLDRPILPQYLDWLGRALRGDLGHSLVTGGDVGRLMGARLAPTLSLVVLATLAAGLLGVGLGMLSAVRGGALGRLIDVLSVAGLAVPGFWLGLLFVSWFAVHWRLFPATGYTPIAESPIGWLRSLVLPVAAASLAAATAVAKQTRDAVLDVLSREYVRVFEANGLSRRSILFRHVLRNAAVPIISLLGVVCAGLLGAAVLIENIFGLPGIGSGAVVAAMQHDIPVLQGAVVSFTLIVIAVGLVVDLLQAWLDPRVRTR